MHSAIQLDKISPGAVEQRVEHHLRPHLAGKQREDGGVSGVARVPHGPSWVTSPTVTMEYMLPMSLALGRCLISTGQVKLKLWAAELVVQGHKIHNPVSDLSHPQSRLRYAKQLCILSSLANHLLPP